MCEIYTLLQEIPANLVTKISKKLVSYYSGGLRLKWISTN